MRSTMVGKPCRRCGRTMEQTRHSKLPGIKHVSRGLCDGGCYTAVLRAGELHLYPRESRNREDVMAKYAKLRQAHPRATTSAIARAMGMPRSTLTNALARAADAGDPRSDYPVSAARAA